jgi:hypothetical protein
VTFDAKRTSVAQSAFDFSRYFSGIFNSVRVAGGAPRRPTLVAPEGMSTSGGKRARQSLVLQPDDATSMAVTVGWVDVGERRGMLRTHVALVALHRERFGARPFDVDLASYEAFFEQARSFLQSCGFNVKVENEAQPASAPLSRAYDAPPPRQSEALSSAWVTRLYCIAAFLFGIVTGGLLVYAQLVWRRR